MANVHYGDIDRKTAIGNFIDSSVNNRNVSNYIGDNVMHIGYKERSNALKDLLSYTVIAAMHDSSERDNAARCHPDTRTAVKAHIMAQVGHDGAGTTKKQVIWLSGPAGAGKTAIMSTVADELQAMGKLAGTFFFSSSSTVKERGLKKHLITTIAYQLIQHKAFGHIRDAVLSSIDNDPSIFGKDLKRQMECLILKPLRESQVQNDDFPDTFILDGLDECGAIFQDHLSDDERRDAQRQTEADQAEIISVLLGAVSDSAFPFRILVASRPEPTIKGSLSSSSQCHEVFLGDDYNPDVDIAIFLDARFCQIRCEYGISPSWPGDNALQRLVRDASGQFIYAATVIRFVEAGQNTPQNELDSVLNITLGEHLGPLAQLDALYARVLKSCRNPVLALQWLKAYNRLNDKRYGPTKAWFWCRLCETAQGEANFLPRHLSALLCVSDLGIPHKASLSFYHKSFQDFLSEPRRYRKHFPGFDEGAAEQWLKDKFTWVFENKKPQVQLHHPYHHEVFLEVTRKYWNALDSPNHLRDVTTAPHFSFDGGMNTDVILPLVGIDGGMSLLIRQLTDSPEMRAENEDASGALNFQATTLQQAPDKYEALNESLGGRRIVFLDTPLLEFGLPEECFATRLQEAVRWIRARYRRDMLIGATMYIHTIGNRRRRDWPEDARTCLEIFQQPELSNSPVLFLTTRWDRVGNLEGVQSLLNLRNALPDECRAMINQRRLSVHHLVGRYGPTVPIQDLQEPWEVIQGIVTTMHARDVVDRIRRMQESLDTSTRSGASDETRKKLQSLHIQAEKLQGQTGTGALWDELHWEVIQLKAAHPELDPLGSGSGNPRDVGNVSDMSDDRTMSTPTTPPQESLARPSRWRRFFRRHRQ